MVARAASRLVSENPIRQAVTAASPGRAVAERDRQYRRTSDPSLPCTMRPGAVSERRLAHPGGGPGAERNQQ